MQLTVLRRSIDRLENLHTTIHGCLTDLSNLISTLITTQDFLERLYNAMDAEDVGGFHQRSDEE
ncbi:hypothetical protein J3458_019753 [Metarhizium acridum]|uniref:uncharacterized protein n=1 Tax=Metarhizium acridum TaxID=92637 RepID=UPI001C6B1D3A|nr:hypothetical protein J3458_019753 [Metarhizium acridum]